GFSARKLEKVGLHCSDTAELTFEDVRVPVSNIIGEENMGFYYIMESFQLERLVGSFMGVGACEHCMEVTLQYINERKAFGRTISKFQVIRHTIAQLAAEFEAARQLAYYTAWLHDNGQHAVRECSFAKLITSELAKKMSDECLQFFGGYGYMDEYIISRMYRDARVGTIAAGTSEILKEIIAKITIDDVRYDAVYGKPGEELEAKMKKAQEKGEGGKEAQEEEGDTSLLPKTAADIIRGLPGRLRRDRAGDWETVMHFDITGPDGGRFTVKILGGGCTVEDGFQGDAKCLMETDDRTYADVELGRADPQAVFMSGKIKVSNLAEMMQFTRMFARLFKKKN
ncbi:MAG: acyl-CoA dehydrogenase family protein, partial [Pseudomonadota bacterium]